MTASLSATVELAHDILQGEEIAQRSDDHQRVGGLVGGDADVAAETGGDGTGGDAAILTVRDAAGVVLLLALLLDALRE